MLNFKPKQPSPSFVQFLWQLLIARWRTLLLLLLGVGFPLLVFEQLAIVVWRNQGGFPWDEPILLTIHTTADPQLDQIAATLTRFGVFQGVFPVAAILSVGLLYLQRWRSFAYLLTTLLGSIVINRTVKAFLHRMRPSLWNSVSPEFDFAFPSGHAMSSMTLVAALVILTWGTRWCAWIATLGGAFVLAIGWTRLYLGVHFPSDILAGWLVSIAWAIGVSIVIKPHPTRRAEEVEPAEETSLLPEEAQAVSSQQP